MNNIKAKNLVCSRRLSKRLKDLGAKQDSLFYWYAHREMGTHELIEWRVIDNRAGSEESLSAFTVGELALLLPPFYEDDEDGTRHFLVIYPNARKDMWLVDYRFETAKTYSQTFIECEKKLADAMAQMLIYLLEKDFIKL